MISTRHYYCKMILVKTENRWVRPVESEKTLSEEEKKTQETIRKFRGILNKLTPQKFQTLISQVLELDIDTPERLEEIINITFEKAITEPAFSVAYANLCRCLIPTNVKITQDGKEQSLTFRKILLNKCQKEFEREKDDEQSIHKKMEELLQAGLSGEELKVKKAELALEELKGRRRTLGNIRFIGELYKLK
ncbi:Eukaryotic translation initiation factor 4 gamma 1, partial [Exaiptasia diaphana]